MFVTNRVQIIRSNTDTKQWQHIDTKNNPADHASRGSSAEKLMRSNWFSGPAFLWEKEIPTTKEEIPNIRIGDPEVKATVHTNEVKESFNLIKYVSRFSNWTREVRVISHLRRPFKENKQKTITTTVAVAMPPVKVGSLHWWSRTDKGWWKAGKFYLAIWC